MVFDCWNCQSSVEITAEKYYNPHDLSFVRDDWDKRKSINKRIFCEKCKIQHNKLIKERAQLLKNIKSEIMLENAITCLEKQNVNMLKYKGAIDNTIEEINNNAEKFLSSQEIVVAIVFNYNGIQHEVNLKIGKYVVDFYLPVEKAILEIDGHLHNIDSHRIYDANRDIDLRNALGVEWEIIHIPATYAEKYAVNIPKGINKIKAALKEIRRKNSGILPESFAKRFQSYYSNILNSKGGASR